MKRLMVRFPAVLAWPLLILLGVYFLGVWVSIPWFTFHDVRDTGFSDWIAGGELRTLAKTLSWPVSVIDRMFPDRGMEDEFDFMLGSDPVPLPSSALPFKPVRYSRFLSCLREKKAISMAYLSEPEKVVEIQVRLKRGEGLVIKRDTFYRPGPSGGNGSGSGSSPGTLAEAHVRMTDRDKDAALDVVEIKTKNLGENRFRPLEIENPEDERLIAFWEATLEILYNSSECPVSGSQGTKR
jgi:hypothetical protein